MENDISDSTESQTVDIMIWIPEMLNIGCQSYIQNVCCSPGTSYRTSIAKPEVKARASETNTCQDVGLIIQSALGSITYWLFSAWHDVQFWRNSLPCIRRTLHIRYTTTRSEMSVLARVAWSTTTVRRVPRDTFWFTFWIYSITAHHEGGVKKYAWYCWNPSGLGLIYMWGG